MGLLDEIDARAADIRRRHVPPQPSSSGSLLDEPGPDTWRCMACGQSWPCPADEWAEQWTRSLTRTEAHSQREGRR